MTEGPLINIVGAGGATVKVALGPAAGEFPSWLDAVPAIMDIPSVPLPVMLEMVTSRVVVPAPVTETAPFAVPVLFKITLPLANLMAEAPE